MSECSQSGPDVRPLTLRQGDRLVYGGQIIPATGSTITNPVVEAQVRTRPEGELVHDFGSVTLTGPDVDGAYTYEVETDDTADWPVGKLNLGVRVTTDETGPQTVAMRPITCKLAGVVEVAP